MFDYEVIGLGESKQFTAPQQVKGSNIIGAMYRFLGNNVTKGLGMDVMKDVKTWIVKNGEDKLTFRAADIIGTNWHDWGTFEIKKVILDAKL